MITDGPPNPALGRLTCERSNAMSNRARMYALLVGLALTSNACQPSAVPEATGLPAQTHTPTASSTNTPRSTTAPTLTPTSIPTPVVSILIHDKPGPLYEKVFDVPVDEQGITYMDIDVPEGERTGPAALVVASDGSFYVADTVGGRVLHYSSKGDRLSIITPSEQVVGIADLAVIDSDVVVLDIAAVVPRVLRCSPDGKVEVSYDLPEGLRPENGLSGMAVGENGEVLIELEFGATLYQLTDPAGIYTPKRLEGRVHRGRLYKVVFPYLIADDSKIEFKFSSNFGGLYFLGTQADGSFYVVQEDVVNVSPVEVDQTVHYFNAEGRRLGMARVPLAERFIPVTHGLAVGPEGIVYAMITRRDHVEIVSLNFFEHLEPLIPSSTATP